MYAIIKAGGRQHKVTPGGILTIDGTAGSPGSELTIGEVLLVEKDGGEILAGAPFVANARVVGVVESASRGDWASFAAWLVDEDTLRTAPPHPVVAWSTRIAGEIAQRRGAPELARRALHLQETA